MRWGLVPVVLWLALHIHACADDSGISLQEFRDELGARGAYSCTMAEECIRPDVQPSCACHIVIHESHLAFYLERVQDVDCAGMTATCVELREIRCEENVCDAINVLEQ